MTHVILPSWDPSPGPPSLQPVTKHYVILPPREKETRNCVTLGKLFNMSEPQFICKMGMTGLSWELNKLKHVKRLVSAAPCPWYAPDAIIIFNIIINFEGFKKWDSITIFAFWKVFKRAGWRKAGGQAATLLTLGGTIHFAVNIHMPLGPVLCSVS